MKPFLFLSLCLLLLAGCGGGSGDQVSDSADTSQVITQDIQNDAKSSDDVLQKSQEANDKADSILNNI